MTWTTDPLFLPKAGSIEFEELRLLNMLSLIAQSHETLQRLINHEWSSENDTQTAAKNRRWSARGPSAGSAPDSQGRADQLPE